MPQEQLNTGRKIYTTLIEVYEGTLIPTGRTKPNLPNDPNYQPPVTDIDKCPINIPLGQQQLLSDKNLLIYIQNESDKVINWNAERKAKFGDFPIIDVWLLQIDNSYEKVNISYSTNTPPPNTSLITLDFGAVSNGFLIIS